MSNDNKTPKCKSIFIKTDTEGHDLFFEHPSSFFIINSKEDHLIVRTFKDQEHIQLDKKYVVNLRYIISVEYTYY